MHLTCANADADACYAVGIHCSAQSLWRRSLSLPQDAGAAHDAACTPDGLQELIHSSGAAEGREAGSVVWAGVPGGEGAFAQEAVRLRLAIGLCGYGHTVSREQADSSEGGGTYLLDDT